VRPRCGVLRRQVRLLARSVVPNCVARVRNQLKVVVAQEVVPGEVIKDSSQLVVAHPTERGVVTDWPTQLAIWKHALASCGLNAKGQSVIVTIAPLSPPRSVAGCVSAALDGLGAARVLLVSPGRCAARIVARLAGNPEWIEAWRADLLKPFPSLALVSVPPVAASRAMLGLSMGCAVVVDLGFSSTIVSSYVYLHGSTVRAVSHVPLLSTAGGAATAVFEGGVCHASTRVPGSTCIPSSVKRVAVGGRLRGGLVRDWVSLRAVDLSDDTVLARALEHQTTAVALDYEACMKEVAWLGSNSARQAVREVALLIHKALCPAVMRPFFAADLHGTPSKEIASAVWTLASGKPQLPVQFDAILEGMLRRAQHAGQEPGAPTVKWISDQCVQACQQRIDAAAGADAALVRGLDKALQAALAIERVSDLDRVVIAHHRVKELFGPEAAKDSGIGIGIRRFVVLPDRDSLLKPYLVGGSQDPAAAASVAQTPYACSLKGIDQAVEIDMDGLSIGPVWGWGWSLPVPGFSFPALFHHMDTAGGSCPSLPPVLPDESTFTIVELGPERLLAGEAVFRPGDAVPSAGLESTGGLAEAVVESIAQASKHAPHWASLLWQSVCLVGGGARIPGITSRLTAELRPFAPASEPLCVWSVGDGASHAVWSGVSSLGAAVEAEEEPCPWVTASDKTDEDPSAVHTVLL
jgi:hypothetical protein